MTIDGDPYPYNWTLSAISVRRRRGILSALRDGESLLTVQDLAGRLAATRPGSMGTGGTTPEIQTLRIGLLHNHLPALEDVGLIEWNHDDETLEMGSHPALADPRFQRLLEFEAEDLDPVLSGLSHEHCRIVLTVLKDAQASVTLTDLAREIRRRETEITGCVPPAFEDILASLHHGHLPNLAVTGLIEYDSDTDRAAYTSHVTLDSVFRIIYEPNERVADKLDGFLGGLHDSYRQASRDASEPFDWPHFWRKSHHG